MLLNNTTSINKLLGRFTKTAGLPLVPVETLHSEGLASLGLGDAEPSGNQAEEALNAPRRGNIGADIGKLREAEYRESIRPGGENFGAHQKALTEEAKALGFGKIKAGLVDTWDGVADAGRAVRDGVKTLLSGDWIGDEKALEEELARRSEGLGKMPLEERQKELANIGKKHSIVGRMSDTDPRLSEIGKQYESFYDDAAQAEPLKPSRTEPPLASSHGKGNSYAGGTSVIPHDKGNSYTGRDIIGGTPTAPKASGSIGADIAGLRRAEQAIGAEGRSASELLKALGIGGAGAVGAYGMRKAYKASKARKAVREAREAHLERLLRSIR